ncbi:hypothetical protein [Flavobacterium litorale]|uniref:Addiction module component n=1 Tax=Flavobacterium litorale TaxID=2856519 RepID=A0ABX8V554_9FLAO|nr:hypothetical protein [Flavobacterium litorale]QYJ67925.1 hypothetical protein K1I41_10315 [Flavobacterium litorale]
MFKKELEELFNTMPQLVKDKLKPVLDNILERAGEVDEYGSEDPEYYEEERELIMKDVHKVKYLNDQWRIIAQRDA